VPFLLVTFLWASKEKSLASKAKCRVGRKYTEESRLTLLEERGISPVRSETNVEKHTLQKSRTKKHQK
jgi:hypothetical protein